LKTKDNRREIIDRIGLESESGVAEQPVTCNFKPETKKE
jgi:hypothetical protein